MVASAAFLLALATWYWPCRTDVGDFAPCTHFFYSACPPKGFLGVPICQRHLNQYRFATLYSRTWRAPWFSAYTFSPPVGKRPKEDWKYEPQVDPFCCISPSEIFFCFLLHDSCIYSEHLYTISRKKSKAISLKVYSQCNHMEKISCFQRLNMIIKIARVWC